MWLNNYYLAFTFFFIFLRVGNVIAIWYVLKLKRERKKERKKERKTGEIPKDRICGDQYISDILLIWKKGFRNDDGGEILGSLSKCNDEEH